MDTRSDQHLQSPSKEQSTNRQPLQTLILPTSRMSDPHGKSPKYEVPPGEPPLTPAEEADVDDLVLNKEVLSKIYTTLQSQPGWSADTAADQLYAIVNAARAYEANHPAASHIVPPPPKSADPTPTSKRPCPIPDNTGPSTIPVPSPKGRSCFTGYPKESFEGCTVNGVPQASLTDLLRTLQGPLYGQQGEKAPKPPPPPAPDPNRTLRDLFATLQGPGPEPYKDLDHHLPPSVLSALGLTTHIQPNTTSASSSSDGSDSIDHLD